MENKELPEFDICTTRGGHRFLLTSGPDYISGVLRGGELWNTTSINISQRLLEFVAAPVIYDIGANLGSWTIPVGNYFQHRNGIVYSFEPQRQVYNQLCGNIYLNKLKNCYTFNSAIGDYDGETDVPVPDPYTDNNLGAVSLDKAIFLEQRCGSEFPSEKGTINMLDTLNMPHASLLKIDVQGMELEVLKGGRKWIQASGYRSFRRGMSAGNGDFITFVTLFVGTADGTGFAGFKRVRFGNPCAVGFHFHFLQQIAFFILNQDIALRLTQSGQFAAAVFSNFRRGRR